MIEIARDADAAGVIGKQTLSLHHIRYAARELRRRGDTLVHKEDLAIVVACARLEVDDPPPRVAYYEGLERATESLERAIKDP